MDFVSEIIDNILRKVENAPFLAIFSKVLFFSVAETQQQNHRLLQIDIFW